MQPTLGNSRGSWVSSPMGGRMCHGITEYYPSSALL